jgi:hypothetical protein
MLGIVIPTLTGDFPKLAWGNFTFWKSNNKDANVENEYFKAIMEILALDADTYCAGFYGNTVSARISRFNFDMQSLAGDVNRVSVCCSPDGNCAWHSTLSQVRRTREVSQKEIEDLCKESVITVDANLIQAHKNAFVNFVKEKYTCTSPTKGKTLISERVYDSLLSYQENGTYVDSGFFGYFAAYFGKPILYGSNPDMLWIPSPSPLGFSGIVYGILGVDDAVISAEKCESMLSPYLGQAKAKSTGEALAKLVVPGSLYYSDEKRQKK